MGAVYTLCCCRHYMQSGRGEYNAILRMRKTSKAPEPAPSDSSDSIPPEEGLFGPKPPAGPPPPDPRQGPPPPPPQATPAAAAAAVVSPPRMDTADTELQDCIDLRDQIEHNTEEWEQLNYDIHSLRYARREVCTRWKKILLQLGYQSEVEALMSVNTQSRSCKARRESLRRAGELLQHLREHSALFPPGGGLQDKYLHVMDCLVTLDSADDFIRLATEKYPKAE